MRNGSMKSGEMREEILKLYEQYGAIEIKCEGADMLSLDSIKDFQGGLKKRSDKNLLRLITNMFMNNFIAPFFTWGVDGESVKKLLDGHSRLLGLTAVRDAGVPIPDKFPVDYIHAADEAEARRFLLSITSQYGQFVQETLDSWTSELEAEIAETLRIVDTEVELAIASITGDGNTDGDDNIPDDVPVITVLGDLWELSSGGNIHRLLCADSTKLEEIQPLFKDSARADQFITDPPYNVDYVGKTKDALTIENDKMDNDSFRLFLKDAFSVADAYMKPGAVFYIYHADSEGYNFRGACVDIDWKVRQCLIWKKNSMVMGRQDYHWKHEPVLYGWKPGAGHLWSSDRKQTTILEFDRPSRSTEHPTMKPVDLVEYCVLNNTKEEDIVLDLFGGSGTTIIACEKTNRVCRMVELDPRYCDVTVHRYSEWCAANNRTAVIKRNGEPYNLNTLKCETNEK